MIPDFPKAKEKLAILFKIRTMEKMKSVAPLYSMVSKRFAFEGDRMGIVYEDGKYVTEPIGEVSSEESITSEEIQNSSPKDISEKISAMVTDVATKTDRQLLQSIEKETSESGNEITEQEVTPNIILDALRKVSISFHDDDRDKPVRPMAFLPPSICEKLKEIEKEQTPEEREEFERREKEILDEKYEEYMQDLESRKIVD